MVTSIGVIASPAQSITYFERDGYYAKDDPAHKEASAWVGKGAKELGLSGPVDPETFTAILEGKVPGGPSLGKRGKDGEIHHRPGRDVTMSAPKSSGRAANSRWASANRASSASFSAVCAASNAGVWRANR